jgi:hypothetical protein
MLRAVRAQAQVVFAILALVLVPVLARADEGDAKRAADAYDRGTQAHERGDLVTAAAEFARADELAPNAVALRAAFEDVIAADDARLGTELLERAAQRALDENLRTLVAEARRRFTGRAGKLRVSCPGAAPCVASVDGRRIATTGEVVELVGNHEVRVVWDGGSVRRILEVKADGVALLAPAATAPAPSAERTGIGPGWFAVTAGASALLGGFTIASGIDVLNVHATFRDQACGTIGSAACDDLRDRGLVKEARTNVLLVTTAVVTAGALVLALFTRWH